MFDVVVIGAGLSGLQAAYTARQAGLSVAVVEARDRVGGKTWSVPLASGRGYADLGAAWVNVNTQKRIAEWVRRFKLPMVEQRLVGTAVMQVSSKERIEFPFGITPEFTPEEKKNLETIRDHIQAESLKREAPKPEDDKVSLDEYVKKLGALPKTVAMINLWVKVMHGVESSEESAAWFIEYCRCNRGLFSIRADDKTGGNYQRFHNGTQQIANGIAELIGHSNIHLSAPVASIENNQTHVTVITTKNQRFVGRKAIVSIPSAMLHELNFSPALPSRVREVTDSARLGHYNKCILFYDKPWWRDLGYNGFFMCYEGPITLARDTSADEVRQFSLTCFVNGKFGEDWSKLYPHERRSQVIKQVAKVFNVDESSEAYRPIEVFDQIWKHEQYSRGALAPITAIGHLTEYADVYGKPVGNLHFVGTEYSNDWKGYMEGALASGEQGAKEVIGAVQRSPRANL
ncbi:flavin-containing amine [Colletotrichum truncatum]|uniref:Flavin-containing amine n=1 Tax=Colletotrichum truncatum TaxID=5467 RepID=A0ACC3YRE0_COLTU|nr:flavin-containing amine [Colletotrichum truncatum]KAF6799181.1 flavin-containing amine [Colletotrichum truncatum]